MSEKNNRHTVLEKLSKCTLFLKVLSACVLWCRKEEDLPEQARVPPGGDLSSEGGREGGPGAPADSGQGKPEEEPGRRSAGGPGRGQTTR